MVVAILVFVVAVAAQKMTTAIRKKGKTKFDCGEELSKKAAIRSVLSSGAKLSHKQILFINFLKLRSFSNLQMIRAFSRLLLSHAKVILTIIISLGFVIRVAPYTVGKVGIDIQRF